METYDVSENESASEEEKNDDWSCDVYNMYFIFVFYQRKIWLNYDW